MSELRQIQEPVAAHLDAFEKHFRLAMQNKVPLLNTILHYILRHKGKHLRPLFVFLSAQLCGQVNDTTFTAATLVELLHTATLVHDDVIDASYERRGVFSVYALWKSKIAVLVGDYLLSRGLLIALDHKEYELLHTVSDAVREMSEGELMQLKHARDFSVTEEKYFSIISKKTASLISACTTCGAQSAKAPADMAEKMKLFGLYAGIAFQLKDDLFDYQNNSLTGKPRGNDIKEKKLSLPLIYALENSLSSERSAIRKEIKNSNGSSRNIADIIRFAHKKGGVSYTEKMLEHYKKQAVDILLHFPESDSRRSLIKLTEYIIDRKR